MARTLPIYLEQHHRLQKGFHTAASTRILDFKDSDQDQKWLFYQDAYHPAKAR